jgi:hypothetical protein
MPKFLRDHIIEVLLGAIVALLAYIGSTEIEHMKERIKAAESSLNDKIIHLGKELKNSTDKLETLECETSNIVANTAFDAMQTEMVNVHLDAKDTVRTYIEKFDRLLNQVDSHLIKCNQGNDTRSKIKNFRDGLQSYIVGDYQNAIKLFSAIPYPDSLTLKCLGVSLNSQSYILTAQGLTKEGAALHERALGVIESAISAAAREFNDISKRRAISSLRCGVLGEGSASERARGIKCYEEVVTKGEHDYSTYYNLSRLAALTKDYGQTIKYMQMCLQFLCERYFTKRFINQDGEFDDILKDAVWGPQFVRLYDQFQ